MSELKLARESTAVGTTTVAGVDVKSMSVMSVLSTATEDRDYDIIEPAGIDLAEHRRNPVVFFNHFRPKSDPSLFTLPIGKAEDDRGNYTVKFVQQPDRLIATTYFSQKTPVAQAIFSLYEEGILRAWSIGVKVLEAQPRPAVDRPWPGPLPMHVTRSELQEYSAVGVGSNRDALTVKLQKGFGLSGPGSAPIELMLKAALEPYTIPPTAWSFGWTPDVVKYSDEQPRDEEGKWTAGSGASTGSGVPANYEEFKQHRDMLQLQFDIASDELHSIPGVASGPMNLTPDEVRASPEYRKAKAKSQQAFAALQDYNAKYAKRFAKEQKADIQRKREAKLKDREQAKDSSDYSEKAMPEPVDTTTIEPLENADQVPEKIEKAADQPVVTKSDDSTIKTPATAAKSTGSDMMDMPAGATYLGAMIDHINEAMSKVENPDVVSTYKKCGKLVNKCWSKCYGGYGEKACKGCGDDDDMQKQLDDALTKLGIVQQENAELKTKSATTAEEFRKLSAATGELRETIFRLTGRAG